MIHTQALPWLSLSSFDSTKVPEVWKSHQQRSSSIRDPNSPKFVFHHLNTKLVCQSDPHYTWWFVEFFPFAKVAWRDVLWLTPTVGQSDISFEGCKLWLELESQEEVASASPLEVEPCWHTSEWWEIRVRSDLQWLACFKSGFVKNHMVNIVHLTAQSWPSFLWGQFIKTLHVTVL